MSRYDCRTAQPGFAAGKIFLLRPDRTEEYRPGSPREECARLEAAAAQLNRRLAEERKNADPARAAVMDAEILILNDEEFLGSVRRSIPEDGLSAPEAVQRAADRVCDTLRNSGQDYIRERCEDVRGLASALTALLQGGMDLPGEPCILAGSELSPGQMTMIGTEKILGILTETGSPASHVSVLAGNMGIPCLYGLENLPEKVQDGDYVILDPEGEGVWVNPPPEKRREAESRQAEIRQAREKRRIEAAGKVTRTRICANISRAEEAEGLAEAGADGIGLFRSELLFLNETEAPSEERQFAAYRQAAEAMRGRETVIRTMDIGSDKHAAWLEMPREINPALGLRGLRVSLEHRDLFRTQLRALLRAAVYGNIRIMVPMVASEWELDEVLKEIGIAAEELKQRGEPCRIPETGVMIETPAAVMIAPALAEKARFFSIGTNDLTQYTLAVDREARGLDHYFDPQHEAVMRMIALTVEAAHEKGIPAAVCGELAGNPAAAEQLIALGVDELSVSPAKLADVRERAAEAEAKLESEKRSGEKPPVQGIRSPAAGELIPMAEIPDPVFSGGLMGECVGVIPDEGKIYAPVSGTVAAVAAARHALSLRGSGEEILIHVGLDTVRLNGEGFRVLVREGDRVEQGQLILEADLDLIRARGFNPMIVVARPMSPAPAPASSRKQEAAGTAAPETGASAHE